MREANEIVPLRCQDCHLFYDDLQRAEATKATIDALSHEDDRDALIVEGLDPKEVDRRFAKAILAYAYLKEKLEYNEFYTVGCTGPHEVELTHPREPILPKKCGSPFLNP